MQRVPFERHMGIVVREYPSSWLSTHFVPVLLYLSDLSWGPAIGGYNTCPFLDQEWEHRREVFESWLYSNPRVYSAERIAKEFDTRVHREVDDVNTSVSVL